ncbi:hypothetical protein ACFL7M_03765 [Thermodesulfobacteriota bacterium]
MDKKIKVVQCGLGFAGTCIVRAMLSKQKVECVGAVDKYIGIGKDVGELLGVTEKTGIIVSDDIEKVLNRTRPDVVIDATTSKIRDIFPHIIKALEVGANVLTLAEEFTDPWVLEPELTKKIDHTAKKYNATIIGTGFIPGLWMDVWPFFLTGYVFSISKITINYMSDLSPYGRSRAVVKNYGFGLEPDQIIKRIAQGSQKLSHGTPGLIRNLAKCLELDLTEVREHERPLVSKVRLDYSPVVVIEPGQVYGAMIDAYGIKNGENIIEIHKGACCKPDMEMEGFGDEPHTEATIHIEGEPNITSRLVINSRKGWSTSAPRLLNWVPYVVKAAPGLLSDLRNFPLIGAFM